MFTCAKRFDILTESAIVDLPTMEIWEYVAIPLLSVLAGSLTGAVAIAIWGYGGMRILNRRLNDVEVEMASQERRLSKEVKRRAGDLGQAAKVDHLARARELALAPPARGNDGPINWDSEF